MFVVKNKRQPFCLVVGRSQVSLSGRRVRRQALPRIVDPPYDVIEVVLLANPRQVRGKVTSNRAAAHSNRRAFDRVTAKTAKRFEQVTPVRRIALRLLRRLDVQRGLPNERRDGLDFVIGQTERRHLRSRPERLRVRKPDRQPFLAEFGLDLFQVWPNLLDILHQVLGLDVVLIDAAFELTYHLTERFGSLSEVDRIFVALGGVGSGVGLGDLAAPVVALQFQSLYALASIAESIRFAIEGLVAMTSDAPAVLKQILAAVQGVCALQHSISSVTLIATGLD